jgi:hypothetical protein
MKEVFKSWLFWWLFWTTTLLLFWIAIFLGFGIACGISTLVSMVIL